MKKAFFLALIALLTLTGCAVTSTFTAIDGTDPSETSSSTSSGTSSSNPSTSSSSFNPSDDFNSLTYEEFWSYSNVASIRLRMSNASAYAISKYGAQFNQKYSDLYFPADLELTLNEKTYLIPDVGVRMKGNLSRREFVNQNGEIYQPSHFKVSFKATFDDDEYLDNSELRAFYREWESKDIRKERKDRRLGGMEKIDLKYIPRNDGNCLNGEMYIYDAFNSSDLLAPLSKPSSVSLTSSYNTYNATYQIVECVDEAFIYHHLGQDEDNQGALYKCGWGEYQGNWKGADLSKDGSIREVNGAYQRVENGYIGEEDVYNGYDPAYDMKFGDDDFSILVNYIATVNKVAKENGILNELKEVLDIDSFLSFEALSYIFGNFDDQRNNYNNYYIYFDPSNSYKATYIAYDWDWIFGRGSDATNYEVFRNRDYNYNLIANPLYFATFLKDSSYSISYDISAMQAQYLEDVKAYSEAYLDIEVYKAYLNKIGVSDKSDVDSTSNYMSSKATLIKNTQL